MKVFKILCAALLAGASTSVFADNTPLWMRYPAISPDGQHIAFCYKGDIFMVNAQGGKATQLTVHPAYDTRPVWSPDSKSLAFSSTRDGGMDVYLMSIEGGTPTRLTTSSVKSYANAFTPDGKYLLFNASLMPQAESSQFPSAGQVYRVPVTGGRPELFLGVEAYHIHFNKQGNKIYYHDRKGYEDEWRKHHTSSVCRDVWEYDLTSGTYTNLTQKEVEDRYPVLSGDYKEIYFVSERFGNTANVCKMPVGHPEKVQQVTRFSKHPVRFLSRSNDDQLCFFYDGEIYTMKPGGSAKKVDIDLTAENIEPAVRKMAFDKGATEIVLSPNEKEFAFVVHGDVFVANMEFGTTRRITNTAAREKDVSFSPDGRSLVYSSERDGQWNIWGTVIQIPQEKEFVYATYLKEARLTAGKVPCTQPAYSPTGLEVAYYYDRNEIRVIDLTKGKARVVLPGKYNYSYSDGDQSFEWSPDGKWILTRFFEEGGWQHPDVCLVHASGNGEIHNLTQSGYSDMAPQFMMGGKAILWQSDRAGFRSHGSWGSERDAYLMFLDPEAYEYFIMSKEDKALFDKQKNAQKKMAMMKQQQAAKQQAQPEKGKGKPAAKGKQPMMPKAKLPVLKYSFEGIENRVVRLTQHSSNLQGGVLTAKGDKFYYVNTADDGTHLWVRDFANRSTRSMSKLGRGGASLQLSKDGKRLFVYSGGSLFEVNQMNGRMKSFRYLAEFELKGREERASLFNHAWQQVCDKFYDQEFKGVDWPFYKKAYERFLPHINNSFDFAECLGEMLGELNASHTGARYPVRFSRPQTAALGVFFDESYKGDGLKIKEIIENSPLLQIPAEIKPGMVIMAIDHQKIEKGMDYYPLLDGKAGKRTLLTIQNPANRKMFLVTVKPISMGKQTTLLYQRWVKSREKMVEQLSGGQLGYVHIPAMDSPSFRNAYSKILGKYRNTKGIIVDTRNNSGGWLHEDLMHLLSGKQFAEFVPRGQFIGVDPFSQWTKKSIVLMNENNYSNGHGFPWAYKETGMGKLVGMPVPGTMTAVWWEKMINGVTFGIPQVTMKDNQGRVLENMQLQPDIKVSNDPASTLKGQDLQLEAAVKELLRNSK